MMTNVVRRRRMTHLEIMTPLTAVGSCKIFYMQVDFYIQADVKRRKVDEEIDAGASFQSKLSVMTLEEVCCLCVCVWYAGRAGLPMPVCACDEKEADMRMSCQRHPYTHVVP